MRLLIALAIQKADEISRPAEATPVSFRRIWDHDKLRVIKVHHLGHTTASLLKKLRVPPRDTQMALGHAHISTTVQIYTHVDEEARNDAITGLDKLLSDGQRPADCGQQWWPAADSTRGERTPGVWRTAGQARVQLVELAL